MYSFVYVLMRLTSLALKQPFFCILSMQTRLVRLISTKTKQYFFGRHLCIRSGGNWFGKHFFPAFFAGFNPKKVIPNI